MALKYFGEAKSFTYNKKNLPDSLDHLYEDA
jgi:hypothetical protein